MLGRWGDQGDRRCGIGVRQDDGNGGGSSGTEVPLQMPVQLGARGDDLKSPRHAPPKSGNATHPGGGVPVALHGHSRRCQRWGGVICCPG